VGGLAGPHPRFDRLRPVRRRIEPRMDRRRARQMGDLASARRAVAQRRAPLCSATRHVASAVHHGGTGARVPCRRLRALVLAALRLVGRGHRGRRLGQRPILQHRAAAGGPAARAVDLQHNRPAARVAIRLPRRILRQDRHRPARRDSAAQADRLGWPGGHPASLHRLRRDIPRDLFHRRAAWPRQAARGDAWGRRRRLRRVGRHCHRRRRPGEEGASADRHHPSSSYGRSC
jgi:hypothetical protein